MKTLCFTGHRKVPGKNYGEWDGVEAMVLDIITSAHNNKFTNYLCGGAIGFDTLAAIAVLKIRQQHPDINLVMAIPSKDQPDKWYGETQNKYFDILSQADKVVYVDAELGLPDIGKYSINKLFARNKYMVDQSSAVVACAADMTTGGGAYCMKYAQDQKIPVLILNPNTLTKQWIITNG